MAVKSFRGGAHPPERKDRTSGLPIEYLRGAKSVVIPVNQHFGAPLQPLVKVGDQVKRGQKIADADGRMTVPVHASVAGVVKKIEPRTQSNNVDGPCIVVEADGSDGVDFLAPLDGFACTKDEALARIREAGIVGMGGAGFPAHVKLAPSKPIALVIANGAECEPYLTIDERVMIERPGDLVEGVALTMKIVGAPKGVIAVEENKAHAVAGLEKAVAEKGRGFDIEVQLLKTKYPQGGEKMLISAVTGKEVPSGGLPMDVGCVVQNIGTLVAMVEAFREGKPLIERGLTISGAACASPKNVVVPIGTLVSDLVAEGKVEVTEAELGRVIFGGPMMGTAVPHYAIPVQKNTSGVLLVSKKEAEHYVEHSCIRCGRCMRACSCRLSPALLNQALVAGDWEDAEKIGLLDCVECGTCSYVCPARIQLVQRFRVGKQLLRAKKQKEAQNACK
ncbi:MAG: electron transport complex subunit RsxC [Spirochaetaceae bacterium]|nr:electron transport complex subunit RsxC [Spirochaetaceae bacterium]